MLLGPFVKAMPPSISLMLPLVIAAADEDRDELKEIWARLLAAAADPSRVKSFSQVYPGRQTNGPVRERVTGLFRSSTAKACRRKSGKATSAASPKSLEVQAACEYHFHWGRRPRTNSRLSETTVTSMSERRPRNHEACECCQRGPAHLICKAGIRGL
jgi:hypothetical protein